MKNTSFKKELFISAAVFAFALLFGFLSPGLVWLSFPVAEGLSCLAALFLCRRTARLRLAGL